jgi:hypothetical protein
MRITATPAGVAAHFAWQHDRPHVWDGLICQIRAFRAFWPEGLERTTLTRTWQRRRVVEHLAGMTERLGSLVHEQGAALEALGRFVPAVREVASRALVAMQPVLQYVVGQMHERQRQQAVEQQHDEQEEHTLQPSRGLGLGM